MTLLCPWVPCVWNSGTADAPFLSSMVSGGWTGKIRRLEGEQGSDVKAVDQNLLEKSWRADPVVDDDSRLLARTHDPGFLVTRP